MFHIYKNLILLITRKWPIFTTFLISCNKKYHRIDYCRGISKRFFMAHSADLLIKLQKMFLSIDQPTENLTANSLAPYRIRKDDYECTGRFSCRLDEHETHTVLYKTIYTHKRTPPPHFLNRKHLERLMYSSPKRG